MLAVNNLLPRRQHEDQISVELGGHDAHGRCCVCLQERFMGFVSMTIHGSL